MLNLHNDEAYAQFHNNAVILKYHVSPTDVSYCQPKKC